LVGRLSGFRAQTGSVAYWRNATFVRRLPKAAAPAGGERGPCSDFASNILAFAFQLRKITENLSQGNGKRWAVRRRTRLVCRLGHRGRWPRLACCPLPPLVFASGDGVNLGQLKYLPSCRTRRFPTSANLESKLSACYLRTKGHQ